MHPRGARTRATNRSRHSPCALHQKLWSVNAGARENTIAEAERWAIEIGGLVYAIDDQTAIKVTDGTVDVVSERHWKYFP
jgi:hypothetical protein